MESTIVLFANRNLRMEFESLHTRNNLSQAHKNRLNFPPPVSSLHYILVTVTDLHQYVYGYRPLVMCVQVAVCLFSSSLFSFAYSRRCV